MTSVAAAANKRKVFSDSSDADAADSRSKKAAMSDSDDDDDRLRQSRMREVMQQTQQLVQPTTHTSNHTTSPTTDTSSLSSAPCTHSCPRCCPRVSTGVRRVTFPFLDNEWLLRPVGGRVAHAAIHRAATSKQSPAALPTSYDSSIATVARTRLHAYLGKQLDIEQHVWPDADQRMGYPAVDDEMDWTQLLAGLARPVASELDGSQQATAPDVAVNPSAVALTSREKRKLKRKQERQALTATQHAVDGSHT